MDTIPLHEWDSLFVSIAGGSGVGVLSTQPLPDKGPFRLIPLPMAKTHGEPSIGMDH